MRQKGYTLIELIVVFTLVVVVGTIGARLFGSIFETTAKANHISQVKQEGEYAMETMARMIRNAQDITASTTCDGSSTNQVGIVNPDGTESMFSVDSYGAEHLYIALDAVQMTSNKLNVGNPLGTGSGIFTCSRVVGRPAVVDVKFTSAYFNGTNNEAGTQLHFINKFSLRTY